MIAKINGGIDYFQLNPQDTNRNNKLSDREIFNHMLKYRNTAAAAKSKPSEVERLAPTGGLDDHLYNDSLTCI